MHKWTTVLQKITQSAVAFCLHTKSHHHPPLPVYCNLMRRRFIVESVTLDMSLVTSYMPGLLAILQSVLPVILLGTTHFGVNYTVLWIILALCALHYSSITLTHLFIVDRVLVATETLAGVLISAALDNKVIPTIASAFVILWASLSSCYKIYTCFTRAAVSPLTALVAYTLIASYVVFVTLKSIPTLEYSFSFLDIGKAFSYSFLSVLDTYIMSIYCECKSATHTQYTQSLFLHGSVLVSSSMSMLTTCSMILLFSHISFVLLSSRRDTSKKTDCVPVSKNTLSAKQPWSSFITTPNSKTMALQFKIPPKVDLCTHNEADLIETGNLSNSPEDINSEFEQVHFEASNNYKTAAQLQEEFERALAQTQVLKNTH